MHKMIRIMAILAVALTALSLLLLLISIPLQPWLARELYNYSDDMLAMLPIFPVLPFVLTLLRGACMVPLAICSGNKKVGIWLEIAVFAVLLVVLPTLSQLLETIYVALIGNTRGNLYMAANSMVSVIANRMLTPASWGQALAYAVCGMSLVYKRLRAAAPEQE